MLPRSKLVLATAVVLLGLTGALLAAALLVGNRSDGEVASSVATSSGAPIGGPFTLVATDGQTVTDQTYRGKWLLIYFGYTFCPDACPTALDNMSIALRDLGADAQKVQPLFITVDPKRDTQKVMSDYLKAFDPRIIGLTGSQAQIDNVTKAYHVYVAAQKSGGGDYLVDHSAFFYVMDGRGKFVNIIAANVSGDEMATKLRAMMSSQHV